MAGGYGPPGGGFTGGGGHGAPPPPGLGGPPPAFGPAGPYGGAPGGPPLMPGAGGDVNTKAPLVVAIIATVVCCNVMFGVPAILFALQAGNAMRAGDVPTARSKVRVAWIVLVLGLLVEAAVVAYHLATSGLG